MTLLWRDYITAIPASSGGTAVTAGISPGLTAIGSLVCKTPGPMGWGNVLYGQFNQAVPVAQSMFFGCRAYLNASHALYQINFGDSVGNGTQFSIIFDAVNRLVTIYDSNGVQQAQSAPGSIPVPTPTSYYEVGAVIATGTGGSVQVRVGGAAIVGASVTGISTQSTANPSVNEFVLTGNPWTVSDIVWLDNSGPAPQNTFLATPEQTPSNQILLPAGTGISTQWAPVGAATNWQAASDTSLDLASYVFAMVPGELDLYPLSPLQGNILGVFLYGVQPIIAGTGATGYTVSPALSTYGPVHLSPAATFGSSVKIVGGTLYTINPETLIDFDIFDPPFLQFGEQLVAV